MYLVWRAGWTLNLGAPWLSIPLFLAELHGYVTFLLFLFMAWDVSPLPRPTVPGGKTVDFFIPTYNEPYDVLAPTIAAAVAVTYPHETYVLDDGRRPWVRDLCDGLGAHYLVRAGNEGAKAGNINAALPHTSGDFIALVDADFVPHPAFIDELLGYFEDPSVAVVQAPQEFYNTGSFQHAQGDPAAWNEQRMFFRVIQPGKNRWNAAFWSGAPSMLRRSAIATIGGIPTQSVTEDLHTSILLHSLRWKTVFHPGIVALGLAPDDYGGFITQRLRWAQGAMQVIRREWRRAGLTLAQRLNYLGSTGTYFDAVRKATMLAVIPLVLFTGQLPIDAPAALFLFAWVAQFSLLTAANIALGRGHYRYLLTELFDLLKMFAFLRATLTLVIAKPLKFRVTPKGRPGDRMFHPFLLPFVVIFGVYLSAIAAGVLRLGEWLGLSAANRPAIIAAIAWAAVLLAILGFVIGYGYYHVSRRRASRIGATLPASVRSTSLNWAPTIETALNDLSMSGCSFWDRHAFRPGESVEVHLNGEPVAFPGAVRSVARQRDGFRVGVEFQLDDGLRAALAGIYASAIFESAPWAAFYGRPPSAGPLRFGAAAFSRGGSRRRAA